MDNVASYTKKVIEHFQKPHNYGKIKDPDGTGKVGNIICGDVMHFYIRVGKNKKGNEIIKDIKFETFGCVAAISTSSVVTDLAKGKTLEQAKKLKKDDIVKELGGMPPIKVHCSVLGIKALKKAIEGYESKRRVMNNIVVLKK